MTDQNTTIPVVTSTSQKWRWLPLDFLKALAIAAFTAPVSIILTSFAAGHFAIDWTSIWHLALGGAASYLLVKLPQPAQTVITGAAEGSTLTVTVPPSGVKTAVKSVS